MSSGVSSKSNTWKERRITLPLPQGAGLPLGTEGLSSWTETERGDREAMSVFSFQMNKPGTLCCVFTSPSHTFFSIHLTNITAHQSLIFLSESLVTENKKSKIIFSKHTAHRRSCLDTWTWVDIRLIASPQHTLRVTAFGWAMWGGGSPEKVCSGIWYQTTHYLQLNLKETLCIYHPGEIYEKYWNIKEQQIIKNSYHNSEVESSIL